VAPDSSPVARPRGDARPTVTEPENVAWCPEHGLHGSRKFCFACGVECEQVPMVENRIGAMDAISEHRPSIDETDEQIGKDHAEGKATVSMTRATARALYFALYDTLNVTAGRDHEPHDVLRMERVMHRFADVGWPAETGE
jgi:hypothetical protein